MGTYQYGPLGVAVTYIGKLPPPWNQYQEPEHRYNLVVFDRHGHSFEAGWSTERSEEKMARAIVRLLAYAKSEGREWDFYGGYQGAERAWRREQAEKIKKAITEFRERDLYKAFGIADRQEKYESGRGPKDWSPIQELREE